MPKIEKHKQVAVNIPVAESPPVGYCQRHFNFNIDDRCAHALRVIWDGCEEQSCELANGRKVRNAQDAIKWIVEQVADQLEGTGELKEAA